MHPPRILLIRSDDETHTALRDRLARRGCQPFDAWSQGEVRTMTMQAASGTAGAP